VIISEHAETIVVQLVYNGNHDDRRSVAWIWYQRRSSQDCDDEGNGA
jgi:hypothetical protein